MLSPGVQYWPLDAIFLWVGAGIARDQMIRYYLDADPVRSPAHFSRYGPAVAAAIGLEPVRGSAGAFEVTICGSLAYTGHGAADAGIMIGYAYY
jgi:hypothetical protein